MNIRKNNYQVENTFKNAVKKDRARIQVGKISPFGLLEMSRQRLRPSLLEINYQECNHCSGNGLVRSIESQALQIIRNLNLMMKTLENKTINLKISSTMSQYLLNYKHELIKYKSDRKNNIKITVDDTLNNKFYIIAENQAEQKTDEMKKEKLNRVKNKKIAAKKYKEKNAGKKVSKKVTIPQEEEKKNIKKINDKKPVKQTNSKTKKVAVKKRNKKELTESISKVKEVKTGWWDQ